MDVENLSDSYCVAVRVSPLDTIEKQESRVNRLGALCIVMGATPVLPMASSLIVTNTDPLKRGVLKVCGYDVTRVNRL